MSNIQNLDQIYTSDSVYPNPLDESYPVRPDFNTETDNLTVAEIINSDVSASELGKITSRYIELQNNSVLHGFTKSGKYVPINTHNSNIIKNELLKIPENAITVPIEPKTPVSNFKLTPVPESKKIESIQIINTNFNNLGEFNIENVSRREQVSNLPNEYKSEITLINSIPIPIKNVNESVSSTNSMKNIAILVKSESDSDKESEESEKSEESEETETEESETEISETEISETETDPYNSAQIETINLESKETRVLPEVAVRYKTVLSAEPRIKKNKEQLRTEYLEKLEQRYIEYKTDDPSWEGLEPEDKEALRELRRLKQKNTGSNRTMNVLTKPIPIQKLKQMGKSVGVNSPTEVKNLISDIIQSNVIQTEYTETLTKFDYETSEVFNFRTAYTMKAIELASDSLSKESCIVLGIMKCNKIKYGVIYDSEMEELLNLIDSEFF